jgi:hypothetical protein
MTVCSIGSSVELPSTFSLIPVLVTGIQQREVLRAQDFAFGSLFGSRTLAGWIPGTSPRMRVFGAWLRQTEAPHPDQTESGDIQ